MTPFNVGDWVFIKDSAANEEYCGIAYMAGDSGTVRAITDHGEVLVEFDALSTMAEAGEKYFVPQHYLELMAPETE